MRKLAPIFFLLLLGAKGSKKNETTAPTPTPEPAPAAPAEPEPPPPAEPAAPKVVSNASLMVTMTFMDGTTRTGKVTGVEKATDYYGDEGWATEDSKLKVAVEVGTTEKYVGWSEIKSITITPGKVPDEVDCTYSSDFNPWMYECTLKTTAAIVLKDGTKGTTSTRSQWRFTFEDGSQVNFFLYKQLARQQDTRELQFGEDVPENVELYTQLQDTLRTDTKGKMVKSITVQ